MQCGNVPFTCNDMVITGLSAKEIVCEQHVSLKLCGFYHNLWQSEFAQ